jgi:putative hydrolases of HD superfamily
MISDRLARQMAFVGEIDRLKLVLRQTYLNDGSRHDNSAEHSWHLAMMAVTLAEYAPAGIDVARVIRMALVHDIVEIDAGDVFIYDESRPEKKASEEQRAAERLFGMLPREQAAELRALWEEFEARQTPDARFAAALDRLEPMLHNYYTGGSSWKEHGVKASSVIRINSRIGESSAELWDFARGLIDECIARGYLENDQASGR